MRFAIAVLVSVACVGTAFAADLPPLPLFSAWMDNPGHIWVSPDGSGLPLDEAYAVGWPGEVDATIHVELLDWDGNPVAFYPADDIWIESDTGSLAICPLGTTADADTDANGMTQFVQPFRAGAQIPPGVQPQVRVAGAPIIGTDLPLTVNSPDVDGDLVVDLSDITRVAQALFAGYDWRVDFNSDDEINLIDIVIFVGAMGDHCP